MPVVSGIRRAIHSRARAPIRDSSRRPWHMRRSRKPRPSSIRRRMARRGTAEPSPFASARMASEVGPTHAADPGIHGQPGNSCSGIGATPRSHMRIRYMADDSSPVVPNSQSMARAWAALPELLGRKQGHQRGHPGTFVEAVLRRPAAVGQLRGAQPVRARGAPARVRRRPAEPGWRRPSAPSRRIPGRTANRHPDSVCSPQVGSTL